MLIFSESFWQEKSASSSRQRSSVPSTYGTLKKPPSRNFGTFSPGSIQQSNSYPIPTPLVSWIRNMWSTLTQKVLNTVVSGFVDDVYLEALDKRKYQNQVNESGIQVTSSLMPLMNSSLFSIGPGRITSLLQRRPS